MTNKPNLGDLLARNSSQSPNPQGGNGSESDSGVWDAITRAISPLVEVGKTLAAGIAGLTRAIGGIPIPSASVPALAGSPQEAAPEAPGRPPLPTRPDPRPNTPTPQGNAGNGPLWDALGATITKAVSPLVAVTKTLSNALAKASGLLPSGGGDAPDPKGGGGGDTPPAPKPQSGRGGKGGGGGLPGIGGLIASNPITAAIAAIPAALGALTAAVKPFVAAFNPAIVLAFNTALDNVFATIGNAVAPILEIFTTTLRQVNNIIAPTFERLKPVIEQFARHLVGILLPALDLVLSVAKALQPLIQVAGQIQSAIDSVFRGVLNILSGGVALLSPLFRILAIVLQPTIIWAQILGKAFEGVGKVFETVNKILGAALEGLIDLFSSLLEPLLGKLPTLQDVFDAMAKVVSVVTRNLVLFAATLFGLIGFTSGQKALKKAFTNEVGQGKLAAPRDLAISSFEEVFKKNLLLAAGAIGGSQTRTTEQALGDIGGQIQEIIDSGSAWAAMIAEGVEALKIIAAQVQKGSGLQQGANRFLNLSSPVGILAALVRGR